jgi:hypothetical protein
MSLPCNRPYTGSPLDRTYVGRQLGLDAHRVTVSLHKLKRIAGLRGDDRVTICLDDGEVYDSLTEESIGNLFDS